MPNRLATETSPYLLQHKDNPIDWWPWCDEAWQLAKEKQLPVFLSVGYSSCHWCHVMAHESFENEEVAQALNRDFVCIKLDREERPDLDEIYMTAVQISNGHGGWPMSLFLTPDQKPFFAGTYFPLQPRGDFPGFLTVIHSLARAWKDSQSEVLKAADEFGSALSSALSRTLPASRNSLTPELLDIAIDAMHQDFDHENGGFGDHPKFPPHSKILFLMEYAQFRPELPGEYGDMPARAAEMAFMTLEKIGLGGIFDHVEGGIHRYSTDSNWHLPHFEKMLYDNGQFLGALATAQNVVEDPHLKSFYEDRSKRTVSWVKSKMTASDGAFMSALDADSEGEEGLFYMWSYSELSQLASSEFLSASGCLPEGNCIDEATGSQTGKNIFHFSRTYSNEFDLDLAKLREVRSMRQSPGLDYKSIAAWNGIMIGALASLDEIELAELAAKVWIDFGAENLPHMIANGVGSGEPFLDDLAMLADGLLDLYDATRDVQYRVFAEQLADQILSKHGSPEGSLFFTSIGLESPFGRTQPFIDGATPSPIGVAIRVLRRLGKESEALKIIKSSLGWVEHAPRATETILREILCLLRENSGHVELSIEKYQSGEVAIELVPNLVNLEDDGNGYCELVVKIPKGLHINSNEPIADWLIPTEVQIDSAFGEASFPDSLDGTYRDECRIVLRVRPISKQTQEFQVRLRYQACTESECYAPAEVVVSGRLLGD